MPNRFDFLRLLFASGVFAYHLVVLASLAEPLGAVELAWGAVAELCIQGFFVISGALVFGSWQRSQTLGLYAEKRFRRLYPAYAMIILIPALISLVVTGALDQVLRYLAVNLVFLNFLAPDLPGLFETHRYTAVNGALWTLKIEVMFYMLLPLLGALIQASGRWKWALLGLIYILAEGWRQGFEWASVQPVEVGNYSREMFPQLARQLPGQLSFFVSGIALWMLRDRAKASTGSLALAGAVLLAFSFLPFMEVLRAAGLAALVAALAWAPGPQLNAARYGDISYGVYITHFPIVQMLIAFGAFAISPWLGGVSAILLVIIASFALWKFVERPALRTDSHYRRAETALDTHKEEG